MSIDVIHDIYTLLNKVHSSKDIRIINSFSYNEGHIFEVEICTVSLDMPDIYTYYRQWYLYHSCFLNSLEFINDVRNISTFKFKDIFSNDKIWIMTLNLEQMKVTINNDENPISITYILKKNVNIN